MKEELINDILQRMLSSLDNMQMRHLEQVLKQSFLYYDVIDTEKNVEKDDTDDIVERFISAKRIEGCSEKTLKYYQTTIDAMVVSVNKNVQRIQTEDLRLYLTQYQERHKSSRVTIDNIRRILSSFFSWMEDEDYIIKSPVRRIHKIKTASSIKETYSDEELEKMRDNCEELRDLAIIDMLASTGMRVGEMVLLNRNDINFAERECVVLGKGDGTLKTTGNDIDEILPAVSRFGGGGNRIKIKAEVIQKLKEYFDKYFGLITDDMTYDVTYENNAEDMGLMMVAEESKWNTKNK